MSVFDSLQSAAFGVVHTLYGETATWTPSSGGETQTGKILFNNPTDKEGFARQGQHQAGMPEFDVSACIAEWLVGTFPGLMELANSKKKEVLFINGNRYLVKTVTQKYDGKSIYATLMLANI